jgi:hypothetical protein
MRLTLTIHNIRYRTLLIERCFDLSRSVEVHLLANVHSGEQALAVGGITSGLVGLSEEVT